MKVAFRALPENDASLKAAAYRYYSSGLERHQAQLHQLVPWQRHQHLASILNLLLMSMALLEFEMMAPLATDSWFPHAYGALGLLEQVGPQGCQESPFFEIFWQLRFFMSYVTLSTRKMSFLGSQTWMEIPFFHREKTEFDLVIDTLLLVKDNRTIKGETLDPDTIEQRQMSDENLDHGGGTNFKFARPDHVAGFERIIQVLVNVRGLVSASASDCNHKRQESLSTAILADSKHLMNQPSLPFNVGLQVTAAASLVAQYAPNSLQKQKAAQLYSDWRGRQLRAKWEDGSTSTVGVVLALSLPHHRVTVSANASPSVSAADAPGSLQSPVEAQQPLSLTCPGFKTGEKGGEEREAR
ncbi:hypothetical protein THAR02_09303 [Trichoderma harzianum]|uniref:Transcription factor domain-containing protein n=1 Tax=Trichoderma harzianum TaxID=5544 RepID=A0A0F9X1M3_TRIHA|nr:hypothetical protein THAR02_09303 [Trichoderma harzianum]